VAIDRSIEYWKLSIGCIARLALLTTLGVTARFTARPGCIARRTLRGTSSLDQKPIPIHHPVLARPSLEPERQGRKRIVRPTLMHAYGPLAAPETAGSALAVQAELCDVPVVGRQVGADVAGQATHVEARLEGVRPW